jgi:hypothetical protein
VAAIEIPERESIGVAKLMKAYQLNGRWWVSLDPNPSHARHQASPSAPNFPASAK